MKNAMKRVMSILLVAMLLVSALPLAASAKSLMDNLNVLPGQETKPTQPAPVVPVVTEAPATPVATEATEAPAAPAAAAFTMMRTAETPVHDAITINFIQENGQGFDGMQGITDTSFDTTNAAALLAKHFTNPERWTIIKVQQIAGEAVIEKSIGATINAGESINIWLSAKKEVKATIIYDENLTANATCYGDKATVSELINKGVGSSYEFKSGTITRGGELIRNIASAGEEIRYTDCDEGDPKEEVRIVVTRKSTTPTTATTTPTTATTTPSGSTSAPETTEYYNKFPYNVYLNIYKDTMVGAPDKTINITKGAAIDGTVTMDEVKALVMNHYKAKDSYGISFDGLYLAEGTWVTNYVTDTEKYDKFIDVDQFRQYRTVYINVMIDSATAKSSSSGTADTSNPKTGDSIYAPIAVLGVSATALAAAMFFYNKKRLAK